MLQPKNKEEIKKEVVCHLKKMAAITVIYLVLIQNRKKAFIN